MVKIAHSDRCSTTLQNGLLSPMSEMSRVSREPSEHDGVQLHERSSYAQRRSNLFRMAWNVINASIIVATIMGAFCSQDRKPQLPCPPSPLLGLFLFGPPTRKPIIYEVVVSVKENSMTIENEVLREDLRAWMRSPAMGLQEYSSDPRVQRRVGRMLANFSAKFSPQSSKQLVVNSIQTCPLDKP